MLLLVALCGAHVAHAAQFTETIDSGWADRWTHSSAEKYTGKFVAESPPGFLDVALKVRVRRHLPPLAAHLPAASAIAHFHVRSIHSAMHRLRHAPGG